MPRPSTPIFVAGTPSAQRLEVVAAANARYPNRNLAPAMDRFITSQRRPDFAVVASPGRTRFVVGGNDPATVASFREQGLPVIRDAFLPGEIEDTVYVEWGTPDLVKGAGGNAVYGGRKNPLNIVAVKSDSTGGAWPVVHEMVHYVNRARYGQRNVQGNKDEVLTELETLARIPVAEIERYVQVYEQQGQIDGYYNRLKDPVAGILHDRVLMTGSLEGRLRGTAARDRAIAVLEQSALARAMLKPGDRRTAPGSMLDMLSGRMVYPKQRHKATPFLAKAQAPCACRRKPRPSR